MRRPSLERVDRKLFDQLEMAVALVGLEEGECDRLHEVFSTSMT